ncbi:hypothetical protein [Nevskia ramosa]|uniref:hypothetical protein n=1 Tax=Nevskia ramosa TaxID=64002 RepID=UPI003D120829
METPVSMNVVGVTRGVMEGRPWCKVHIVEPFSASPDAIGSRASDVSAESTILEVIGNWKLPALIPFIGDLQISKNGARMRLLRVDPAAVAAIQAKK